MLGETPQNLGQPRAKAQAQSIEALRFDEDALNLAGVCVVVFYYMMNGIDIADAVLDVYRLEVPCQ